MLRADSSQFPLGKRLVSVDALRELRDLLSTLQASAGCGKASLKIMPKEGIDETAEAKHADSGRSGALIPTGSGARLRRKWGAVSTGSGALFGPRS